MTHNTNLKTALNVGVAAAAGGMVLGSGAAIFKAVAGGRFPKLMTVLGITVGLYAVNEAVSRIKTSQMVTYEKAVNIDRNVKKGIYDKKTEEAPKGLMAKLSTGSKVAIFGGMIVGCYFIYNKFVKKPSYDNYTANIQ